MALEIAGLERQSQQVWRALRRPQGLMVLTVGAAMAILLVGVGIWAQTPTYRTLLSGLTEEDAAAIVAQLQEREIPYRLEAGGSRILVPDKMVEDVRLLVAGARLPSSGSGFELFDKTQLGATDYAQRINYQRALEGELARTIARLGPVEQARVHLAIPTPSLYLDRDQPATAAVMVKLKAGQRLSEAQVRGIANLVAGSVPGLTLDHLSVVDTAGNVLSSKLAKDNDALASSADKFTAQRELEQRMERDLLAMLERITGPGKATVRVTAAMNWDQQEINSETFIPPGEQPMVRASKEMSESYDRPTAAGGTPGASANLPTYQQKQAGEGQGSYQRKEVSSNFELSKTVAKTVRAPGTITRLSVAVALDREALVSEEQLEQVRSLVAAAAGLDLGRGDTLSVMALPFTLAEPVSTLPVLDDLQQHELIIEALRAAGAGLGPLLLLVALFLLLRRFRSASGPAPYVRTSTVLAEIPAPAGASADAPAYRLAGGLSPDTAGGDKLADRTTALRELTEVAKQEPQLLTQTIATWLAEDQERKRS